MIAFKNRLSTYSRIRPRQHLIYQHLSDTSVLIHPSPFLTLIPWLHDIDYNCPTRTTLPSVDVPVS